MKHIILRGIPGSGKTTKAKALKEYYENKGKKVAIYSRDSFRMATLAEIFKNEKTLEKAYQDSFNNPTENMMIREEFYRKIIDGLELDDDVHVYDMTNTSKEDAYFWFEFVTYAKAREDKIKIICAAGKFGSTHNVPDNVMERYETQKKNNETLWNYLEEYIDNY